jgi:glyoxylase-like metal-dependent hydrolase (beta-lactamase superfamily II)
MKVTIPMELYAIRYGTAPFPLRYLFRDQAGSSETMQTDWLLYMAFVNGHVLQFDTGFRSQADASKWHVTFTCWESERGELLAGKTVDDLVITHAHFDHIQNIDQFPDTRIFISREAMENALKKKTGPMIKRLNAGNLHIFENETELEGIFHVKVIGGHDKGSCVIYFSAGRRDYVLTGDECYVCANALENRPLGVVLSDVKKNAEFTADTYAQGLIPLPCHDSVIFDLYPRVSENIVRII